MLMLPSTSPLPGKYWNSGYEFTPVLLSWNGRENANRAELMTEFETICFSSIVANWFRFRLIDGHTFGSGPAVGSNRRAKSPRYRAKNESLAETVQSYRAMA